MFQLPTSCSRSVGTMVCGRLNSNQQDLNAASLSHSRRYSNPEIDRGRTYHQLAVSREQCSLCIAGSWCLTVKGLISVMPTGGH